MVSHKRIISAILVSFIFLSYSAPILAEEQFSDGHVDEHEHHHGKDGHADEHEHHHGKDGHADEHEHHHGKGGKKSKHEHHHTN